MSEKKSDSTEHATRAPRKDTSRMKTIAVVTIVALALGLFGGWAIAALSQPDADGDVWVISANGATVASDAITLTDPASVVVGLTVDGERGATQAPISKVTQEWDEVFGEVTPRAIIVGADAGGSHSAIVELSAPTATVDTISFPAVGIGGEAIPAWEATQVILLIDGSGDLDAADVEAFIADS